MATLNNHRVNMATMALPSPFALLDFTADSGFTQVELDNLKTLAQEVGFMESRIFCEEIGRNIW